jgi:ABC-type transport system involved in multi-copper enzyme maturation permease subunit
MKKGRPFSEVFASALMENFRFPILEIFAFLYAFGTFIFAGLGAAAITQTSEVVAHSLVNSLTGIPLFIFVILILVNIAYGLGNDLEKGVIQTLLSYPLKRRSILSGKLLSALGISLLLFLGMQMLALFILAPDIINSYFSTVLLTYIANLSSAFLIGGIVLLLALFLKRGSVALIIGIVLYFALSIIGSMVTFLAWTGSDILKVYAVIAPNMALDRYYGGVSVPYFAGPLWVPSFSEVLFYLGTAYILVATVFLLGYVYFERRLGI